MCAHRFVWKKAYLKAANKRIRNVILEEMSSLVVHARPAPHVFVVVLCFTLVQNSSTNSPHDDAEDEEANGEDSVVSCYFFGPIVASSKVCNHDNDGHDQRDTGDGEDDDLRPNLGVFGPWWKVVSWCEGLCGVEDGECGCNHGEDNQTAGKVDASKEDLSNADSDFDFLYAVRSRLPLSRLFGTYQVLSLLLVSESLVLLKLLLLPKGRAQDARSSWCPWWRTRRLERTLERTAWGPGCWWRKISSVGFFHLDGCYVGQAYV
jgi:hypothetical protein